MGTRSALRTTINDVTCNHYRELISARIDDELEAADERRLDDHLDGCASCQAYQNDAFALRRTLRIRAATSQTDESVAIPGNQPSTPLRGASMLRWGLFVIGGTLVAVHAQTIIFTDESAATHLNRHDGVFGTALGIGMLAVAAKPHRAMGLVPVTSTIALLMAIVAIADLIGGRTTMLGESVHVLEFGGLIFLWIISGGPHRMHRRFDWIGHRIRPRTSSVSGWMPK